MDKGSLVMDALLADVLGSVWVFFLSLRLAIEQNLCSQASIIHLHFKKVMPYGYPYASNLACAVLYSTPESLVEGMP